MTWFARFSLFTMVAVLAATSAGCKKSPKHPTPIPGYTAYGQTNYGAPGSDNAMNGAIGRGNRAGTFNDPNGSSGRTLGPGNGAGGAGLAGAAAGQNIPQGEMFENFALDRALFKANTIYFDFDRSTIRKSEVSNLGAVADYLKANPTHALLIEGHCDERGTEEYNRALGERRALSAREYLINQGIGADRIRTLSYGEDRPAVDAHDEAAWSKNRRCEFGVLTPPVAR